jgi:hypothetical protein
LRYVQDDCENFVLFAIQNKTFWCGECTHIPILGQMTMIPSSSLGCKFCHSPPFYVIDCGRQIYYVVHRLKFMSREAIHLSVHNHLVANGKCWKSIEETKRLIAEEVDHTLDVNIFSNFASKTFLANYLFDDSSDDTMELFKGK